MNGDILDRVYLPTKVTLTRREVQEVYQFQFDLVMREKGPRALPSGPELAKGRHAS